ncbi:MAG: four helix bundle protein [Chitinophagales bacterium]|nr:four helix bundle protein [Chitinophagales bacterium]
MAFNFENLRVWQKSLELTNQIHLLTKKFPNEELFILTNQLKKAADSVNLNIAEGSTGQTKPEFKRFLSYSIRSAIEVISCMYIAKQRKLVNEHEFVELYGQYEELIKSIQALRNSL